MKEKILIVEDERQMAMFLEMELAHEGYNVTVCRDGREAYERIQAEAFNIIILDVMVPSLSGIEILRRIRLSNITTPVIMLTAKGEVSDKVIALDMGANDYMTKPFAIEELLARIRVLTRIKTIAKEEKTFSIKDLTLDSEKRVVTLGSNNLELTKTEFDILEFLMKNKGIVLTREQLIEKVWGSDYFGETNIVDVYIRYVRTKLEEYSTEQYISTVRGVGYVVRDN